MKPEKVKKIVNTINDYFDRVESGKYVSLPINYITDKIDWLWKFRHITYEQMSQLTSRATYIIENYGDELFYD